MGYLKEESSECAVPEDLDNNIQLEVEKSWLSVIGLKKALDKNLPDRVVYMKGWGVKQRGSWAGSPALPVALLLHHTAAAATESTSPTAKGNQKGANNGIINYIQNHFKVPAANFTLDRDGTVYVHSAYPVWHAGYGFV
jgi:hypothetical protein